MVLPVFSAKPQYYKNGLWWFTKMMTVTVGESRWEAMNMMKRIQSNRFYYHRQQFLYEIFVEWPELANLIGLYPKVDTSHGILHHSTYEMYRDWQENSWNSDGSFALWIYTFGAVYLVHLFYSYMIPYYWISSTPIKNEEFVQLRMKDAIASTVLEELYGNQYSEFGWSPHDFHYNRYRGMAGYAHPDDPRLMHTASFNRKHKYREHYMDRVGASTKSMTRAF